MFYGVRLRFLSVSGVLEDGLFAYVRTVPLCLVLSLCVLL